MGLGTSLPTNRTQAEAHFVGRLCQECLFDGKLAAPYPTSTYPNTNLPEHQLPQLASSIAARSHPVADHCATYSPTTIEADQ